MLALAGCSMDVASQPQPGRISWKHAHAWVGDTVRLCGPTKNIQRRADGSVITIADAAGRARVKILVRDTAFTPPPVPGEACANGKVSEDGSGIYRIEVGDARDLTVQDLPIPSHVTEQKELDVRTCPGILRDDNGFNDLLCQLELGDECVAAVLRDPNAKCVSGTSLQPPPLPPIPSGKHCRDVTSYDYNWGNDMLCVRADGSTFHTSYEGAAAFLGY